MEVMESFIFLGSKIEMIGKCEGDINRWLSFWENSNSGLRKIWKDEDVIIQTTRRLVDALVFPVAMCGCES